MSDANTQVTEPEEFELPPSGDAAFAALMDVLVPEEDGQEAGEGGEAAPAAGEGEGSPAAAGEGTPAAAAEPAAPAAGDAGVAPVAGEPAAAAGAEPAGVDAATLDDAWGEVATALQTRQTTELQEEAVEEVRTEYSKYVEAVAKHPRELVGQTVPSATGEGEETLRDSEDARDWQDAIKRQLAAEVKDRASRKSDELRPMMDRLHSSIALFQQNHDLIPGTRQFDKELADKFVALAKPYEIRVDNKLTGYAIPVQPLVEQLRSELAASRAAAVSRQTAATPPATPTAQQQRAAEQARAANGTWTNVDAPQAGIQSKAGNSSEDVEDYSTLFGTIGLPNLRI